jgi:hypothetical protein
MKKVNFLIAVLAMIFFISKKLNAHADTSTFNLLLTSTKKYQLWVNENEFLDSKSPCIENREELKKVHLDIVLEPLKIRANIDTNYLKVKSITEVIDEKLYHHLGYFIDFEMKDSVELENIPNCIFLPNGKARTLEHEKIRVFLNSDSVGCLLFTKYNIFCPAGMNDWFQVETKDSLDIEAFIYNRWGELVYSKILSTKDHGVFDKNKGVWVFNIWNGTYQETEIRCSQGSYFYLLEYKDEESPRRITGTITLIR